ncbi:diguanylate cyclase [Candidatus Synechococcus calcipolaris G9]|uniref:Diguanylate cyclase n=1 Tax=Candidatus Synechococcus calcipolaris G9 TaxID=1497997 RepID=A0ABT6EX54_9SYNE|nr:diguanylate cyclase [Candidatus Synechococcus calcipolaris]MDG2990376.1 diguanylate cyclase [Candidatus Synechococcus calcipolaris G9]
MNFDVLGQAKLQSVVLQEPLTVNVDTSFEQVIGLLYDQQNIGLPVLEQGLLVGIITEREVVKAIAQGGSKNSPDGGISTLQARDIMQSGDRCLTLVDLDHPLDILDKFRHYQIDCLPVVNQHQQIEGLLSRQAFRNSLNPIDLLRIKRVEEVMVTQVATLSLQQTISDAATAMAEQGISCLVIVDVTATGAKPLGIITERDVLNAFIGLPDWTGVPLTQIMSQPVLTLPVGRSLWQVHALLQEHHIRRLVIVDDQGNLAGLVTQTNILAAIDAGEADGLIQLLRRELNQATAELRWQLSRQQSLTVAVAESEMRYNTLIAHLPAAVYRRSGDRHWYHSYLSEHIYDLTGYSPKELKSLRDLILPEDLAPAEIEITKAVSQERSFEVQFRIRHKDGSFRWLQDRGKLESTGENLSGILIDITQQKHTEETLHLTLQREMLVNKIVLSIRRSIHLEDIWEQAVTDVQAVLQCDRVMIYRFLSDGSGVVEVECTPDPKYSIMGRIIDDPCFKKGTALKYQKGHTSTISDVYQALLNECHRNLLISLEVKANLVVPLLQGENLWGLLIAHHCQSPRLWLREELLLLQQIAQPLALALQQAELYRNLEAANQELQQMVFIDGLTQIKNRRCFDELLPKEWRRALREQTPLTLVMIDIDFFKDYNDHYGHIQGDETLKQVAQLLQSHLRRPGDMAARFGGEEFVLLLPNTEQAGALEVVHQLQQELAQLHIPHRPSTINPYLTLSFGIATTIPQAEHGPDDLLAVADQALYRAKAEGRDRSIAQTL